ncbi:helix-turn-helix transcriptional regulator [Fluviicola sp.]|uniref:helix-turn-helix domain-containing protein n=1 Tax=Fluviicola sp. TaxID=1917219 RepID=UPI0031D3F4FA
MNKETEAENGQMNGDQELIELGKRIRALRIAKGYRSAEKFALDHNLSRVHYGRWESGKKNITYKSLLILARAHGMTLPEFLAVKL